MTQEEKDKIYDLIILNKFKLSYPKNQSDKNKVLSEFLIKNNIEFNFEISLKNVITYLKNVDVKCLNENCINERRFYGIRTDNRTEYGFYKSCSDECLNKGRSIRQEGVNNSCHKMTDEQKSEVSKNQSIFMKERIKSGEFVPNITNSWTGKSTFLIIDGVEFKYRSSWEAFFHICNPTLLYEKLVVEYFYENKKHNYIVDFIDNENKKVYEVKPIKLTEKDRVKIKEDYCRKWCSENGYEFIFISNEWFSDNFSNLKYLLNDQPDGPNIIRKLRQFEK